MSLDVSTFEDLHRTVNYRVSQKDVYTRLIFCITVCVHLFGTHCISVLKVKLPRVASVPKYSTMKAYGEVEVKIQHFKH
jgi:hypothetical protein